MERSRGARDRRRRGYPAFRGLGTRGGDGGPVAHRSPLAARPLRGPGRADLGSLAGSGTDRAPGQEGGHSQPGGARVSRRSACRPARAQRRQGDRRPHSGDRALAWRWCLAAEIAQAVQGVRHSPRVSDCCPAGLESQRSRPPDGSARLGDPPSRRAAARDLLTERDRRGEGAGQRLDVLRRSLFPTRLWIEREYSWAAQGRCGWCWRTPATSSAPRAGPREQRATAPARRAGERGSSLRLGWAAALVAAVRPALWPPATQDGSWSSHGTQVLHWFNVVSRVPGVVAGPGKRAPAGSAPSAAAAPNRARAPPLVSMPQLPELNCASACGRLCRRWRGNRDDQRCRRGSGADLGDLQVGLAGCGRSGWPRSRSQRSSSARALSTRSALRSIWAVRPSIGVLPSQRRQTVAASGLRQWAVSALES